MYKNRYKIHIIFLILLAVFLMIGCQGKSSTTTITNQTTLSTTATPINTYTTTTATTTKVVTYAAPVVIADSFEFDIADSNNFIANVDMADANISSIRLIIDDENSTLVNSSNYIWDSVLGTLEIFRVYLQTFEPGTYTFVLKNSNDMTCEFTITIILSVQTVFDSNNARDYIHGSSNDIIFNVQFFDIPITHIKLNSQLVDPNNYCFVGDVLTIKSDYLDTLSQSNLFTITMDNNYTHTFSINSNVAFQSNFDTIFPIGEWYFMLQTSEIVNEGINGKSFRIAGNGGSVLVMGRQFLAVDFDITSSYQLQLTIRNNWTDPEKEPYGIFGFNIDDYSKTQQFIYSFKDNTFSIGSADINAIDENTFTISYIFRPYAETYIECYAGYDPSDLTSPVFDLLLDDIIIYKIIE